MSGSFRKPKCCSLVIDGSAKRGRHVFAATMSIKDHVHFCDLLVLDNQKSPTIANPLAPVIRDLKNKKSLVTAI
jgi:hypothetical protein